jgi:hypothetical protein
MASMRNGMLCHGAAKAFAQALDAALSGEQRVPLMGHDGEEKASAGDVGTAELAHARWECRWGGVGFVRWNRCACSTLHQAYVWLCRQRAHYPPDADVWSLRWRWPQEKAAIQRALRAGTYRFDPQAIVQRAHCRTPDLAPKLMRLDRLEHEA